MVKIQPNLSSVARTKNTTEDEKWNWDVLSAAIVMILNSTFIAYLLVNTEY